MLKEFKTFILRGNVLDLAIGIIIGVAFGAVVTSLVNDIIMPPIGFLLGKVNFADKFIDLTGGSFASLKAARDAGAAVIAYGNFINVLINFLIISLVIFLVVKAVNRMMPAKPAPVAAPVTKDCPYCKTEIALTATRCPNCTSQLS